MFDPFWIIFETGETTIRASFPARTARVVSHIRSWLSRKRSRYTHTLFVTDSGRVYSGDGTILSVSIFTQLTSSMIVSLSGNTGVKRVHVASRASTSNFTFVDSVTSINGET